MPPARSLRWQSPRVTLSFSTELLEDRTTLRNFVEQQREYLLRDVWAAFERLKASLDIKD